MSDLDSWSRDRWWNTALQRWIYPNDMTDALDAATLAIDEYHNGDRAWAEQWLLRAYEANQKEKAKWVSMLGRRSCAWFQARAAIVCARERNIRALR